MEATDLVTKCPEEKFTFLVHETINKLLGQCSPSYQKYSGIWDLEEWWQVVDLLEKTCRSCSKESCEGHEISQHTQDFPEQYQKIISSVLVIRKDDLRHASLAHTEEISGAYLKDFDWKLKLVLASDKLASIQEPLLTLDLDVQTAKGDKLVSMEMDKTELKKLIVSLEAANKAVVNLKT